MADIKTGTIEIKGLAALEKQLQTLSDKIAKNVMRRALSSGAAVIRDEARRLAPRDTGEMVRDILIKRAKQARGSGTITYQVFVRTGRKSRLAGKKRNVDRDSFYWRFQEFGTSRMPAQPFMRPAFDTKKQEAAEAIRDALEQGIDKELLK